MLSPHVITIQQATRVFVHVVTTVMGVSVEVGHKALTIRLYYAFFTGPER